MTKHKTSRRKRSQKGGGLLNWFSGETDPNAPTSTSSWGNWFSGKASGAVSGASNALTNATTSITQGATDATNAATNALNSNVNLTDSTPTSVTSNESSYTGVPVPDTGVSSEVSTGYIGGRRKRRGRTMKGGRIMKGGKGGLGLTYYATPVSGLNVAKPTYWIGPNTNQYIKGGSKKRHRKGCKSRKSRKSRKHRKH